MGTTEFVGRRNSCRRLFSQGGTLEQGTNVMTDRLIRLLVSTLLLAAIGCRNSVKTASAAPTPLPTPAAQAGPPAPAPATRAQVEVSPQSPVEVTPPASFSSDQLKGDTAQFMVKGQAGQFLRVKVNAGSGVGPESLVSAQLLSPVPRELKALNEQGDCAGNFVYPLPEAQLSRRIQPRGAADGHRLQFARWR